jgi:putative Holliday junction resolvase
MSFILPPVRFVGIDYGNRRVGLAISDATAMLARPWQVVTTDEPDPRNSAAMIADFMPRLVNDEDGLDGIVVGLPLRLDGTENAQTANARLFGEAIEVITGLPVMFQDERLTSVEAEAQLAEREKDWKKRKLEIDAVAAAIMLQDFLDARVRG